MTQTATPRQLGAEHPLAEDYRRKGWWPGEQLADRFERFVEADPTHLALVDDRGNTLTRQELWSRAHLLSRGLISAGVQAGDAVLIYLPNCLEWQVSLLACLQIDAVPATLPLSTDAHTLRHVHEVIGSRAIIGALTSRNRATGEWVRDVAASSAWATSVLLIDDEGTESWAWAHGERRAPVVPAGVDHLMFTSSTTGMPKAVMHTADTLAAVNLGFAQRFGITEDTPIFMPSPLGHSVGAWHGGRLALHTGATLVLQERWDPVRGLALIDEHQCVFTAAATPFLKDIVDAEWPEGRTKLASLKYFLCGGAPVPPSLLEQAAEQAPNTLVTVLWGMTEGAGTTGTTSSSPEQLTDTAGTALPDLELTILDPDETGAGELAIRGPGVFVGYLGQEELYTGLVTPDGFFRTGDLARIGEDGYLRLTGRLKDLIIRGGVNISPVPIENAIAAHPDVLRVAVIGEPDERLGERICAVIVARNVPPTLDELVQWLTRAGVSARKLPESLRVVDEMPVTAAGKIRKADLRRTLEENA